MVADKDNMELIIGSAIIFGVGFLSGCIVRRYIFKGNEADPFKSVKKVSRLISNARLGRSHKMVFVVRQDLGMGKGKIAAQCSHAAIMCYQKAKVMTPEYLESWESTGVTKICLKADGDENCLKELQRKAKDLGVVTAIVRDAGHTQIAAGSQTVLGLGPAPIDEIDKITGHLKLL